jgi:site-specific DNA-methyltransferase (adenine-specific)
MKPYFQNELGALYNCNCVDLMPKLRDIDLVVTSPPYDNLRNYEGYSFDFPVISKWLSKIIKKGGIIVWIVGDATINGSETGTSFKQALHFKDVLGLNLHDTMIWDTNGSRFQHQNRYLASFQYMFIFSKGKPKTYNLIKDKKNKDAGKKSLLGKGESGVWKTNRKRESFIIKNYGKRTNIWKIFPESNTNIKHPAPFPLKLIMDHIYSWSNVGDVVFDPFMGSGTTAIAARALGRKWIGCEISQEYCKEAKKRIGSNKTIRRFIKRRKT